MNHEQIAFCLDSRERGSYAKEAFVTELSKGCIELAKFSNIVIVISFINWNIYTKYTFYVFVSKTTPYSQVTVYVTVLN
jgi:hypothetical protein